MHMTLKLEMGLYLLKFNLYLQLLPHFVVNELRYPGIPGLFVSVLVSGALRQAHNIT